MAERVPTLRMHANGQYVSKWDGRYHYFGTDLAQARGLYAENLKQWAEWREARRVSRTPLASTPLVDHLVAEFLEFKEATGGQGRRRYYREHLARFKAVYGNARADLIRPKHLQALKVDMLRAGYHPKTIAHDLGCVKTMFRWAAGMEKVAPVNFDFVKPDPLPPPKNKALTLPQVKALLKIASPSLRPWLAVNYLTMARPTEMVLIVNGKGTWEQPWLFACVSKTTNRSGELRRIVFSSEALGWLKKCRPNWSREDSYYRATERAGIAGGPHPLRHTGATHLAQQGVAVSDIDLLLGHLPNRVTRTYVQTHYSRLRPLVSRLTLR